VAGGSTGSGDTSAHAQSGSACVHGSSPHQARVSSCCSGSDTEDGDEELDLGATKVSVDSATRAADPGVATHRFVPTSTTTAEGTRGGEPNPDMATQLEAGTSSDCVVARRELRILFDNMLQDAAGIEASGTELEHGQAAPTASSDGAGGDANFQVNH
jgi:hypothetical protein